VKELVSKSSSISAVLLAVFGGLFFGLFSCGGYVWHQQLFAALFIGILLVVLFVPSMVLNKAWKRILLVVIAPILFLVVRSASSTFYPTAPESWSEFLASFIRGLQYGPC